MLFSKSKAEVLTWGHLILQGTFSNVRRQFGFATVLSWVEAGMPVNTCRAQDSPLTVEVSNPNVNSGRLRNGYLKRVRNSQYSAFHPV